MKLLTVCVDWSRSLNALFRVATERPAAAALAKENHTSSREAVSGRGHRSVLGAIARFWWIAMWKVEVMKYVHQDGALA